MADILVVEDTVALREEIRFILEMEGHRVIEAQNGQAALRVMDEQSFELIVCDIMMPVMDGLEFLNCLEEQLGPSRPAFIFLTARSSMKDMRAGMTSGADDYLTKPFEADELLAAVDARLKRKEAVDKFIEEESQEYKLKYEAKMDTISKELKSIRFDQVTSMPNFSSASDALDEALKHAIETGHFFMCCLVAIENYPLALRTFGLEFANGLRKEISNRLMQDSLPEQIYCVKDDRTFAIWCVNEDREAIETWAKGLDERLNRHLRIADQDIRAHIAIGMHLAKHEKALEREQLLMLAEDALFMSRNQFHGRLSVSGNTEPNLMDNRLMLDTELFRAVEEGQLVVHYQPKLHSHTHEVVGMEALVRWVHPEIGPVSPAVFIPMAEANGLINKIGRFVLRQALEDIAKLEEQGLRVPCSVNVSPVQWKTEDVHDLVVEELARSQVAPEHLYLELTESGFLDDADQVMSLLAQLREIGVQVSLDDFGTGFSSFSMLSKMPLDELKIDRAFVANIPGNTDEEHIARAIIDIGLKMGLSIVAEGIETEEQSEWLKKQGCQIFQGFFFARPLDYSSLLAFLKSRQS